MSTPQIFFRKWLVATLMVGTNTLMVGSNKLMVGSNTLMVGNNTLTVGSNTLTVGSNTLMVGSNKLMVGSNTLMIGSIRGSKIERFPTTFCCYQPLLLLRFYTLALVQNSILLL